MLPSQAEAQQGFRRDHSDQAARHQDRPYTLDYVDRLFTEFTELHGDRRFADDGAIVCGFARHRGAPVVADGVATDWA